MCPEEPEPDYQIQLQVAPTQDEFIRGRLPHNPYLSSDTGPLMRDVKNFICRQLAMDGKCLSIEDTFCTSMGAPHAHT